ncbi:uncharacterized protein Aud_004421 [Aspergillus udagawae]|uniref:Inositol hexakisphosphate and diphosphoinositol-pentakisphosphate kinase n=1 Tax=Aspergillus udagawae TaxID=91492 RepID=A0A8E0UZT6_9EURO|nr:uncharacterized protein Aud_004421 [Aspergillus udagawae]GIC88030.1 hypothetical protein Aud_004421 [Aspergillus udagawae]
MSLVPSIPALESANSGNYVQITKVTPSDLETLITTSVDEFQSTGCSTDLLSLLAQSAAERTQTDTVRYLARLKGKVAASAGIAVMNEKLQPQIDTISPSDAISKHKQQFCLVDGISLSQRTRQRDPDLVQGTSTTKQELSRSTNMQSIMVSARESSREPPAAVNHVCDRISMDKPSRRTYGPDKPLSRKLRLGICAMEEKARSKANQEIFSRLESTVGIDIVIFGDQVLQDKPVEAWPHCDVLIAFYSHGFPLAKAIAYTQLRPCVSLNDLHMQRLLLDRRLCHRVLVHLGVRTPKRLEVSRDGGPKLGQLDRLTGLGLRIDGQEVLTKPVVSLSEDCNTLVVDGRELRKPFVEKPVDAEDHNINIYYPGGGGRRLFRRIGNKASEYDPRLTVPRCITEGGTSYVYEPLLTAEGGQDVKAYTVGFYPRPYFSFAVTRPSPAVVGVVVRDANGRERRDPTELTGEEREMAAKISTGFGQAVCGFDIVRMGRKSFVIDVNGWTSVKNQSVFYDEAAGVLSQMLLQI